MPAYDFSCQRCGKTYELTVSVDKRDGEWRCPKGHLMQRQVSAPMATLWAGKFHSPWNKKVTGEW